MKKQNNKNGNRIKNSAIAIIATLPDMLLLKNIVEKLAGRRYDIGYGIEIVQPGWKAIETSSIEAHVSGDMILSCETDLIKMPFVTCYLFTCNKENGEKYNLSWASSLS